MLEEAIPKGLGVCPALPKLVLGCMVTPVCCDSMRAPWSSQPRAGVLESEPAGSRKAWMQKGMT